jgi:serine/threonine-protein kinase
MPTTTVDELTKLLTDSSILDSVQLSRYRNEAIRSGRSVSQLCDWMLGNGFITGYQSEQLQAGQVKNLILGGYVLLEPLGSGGMGDVFKGWQKRLNRPVAIKRLRTGQTADDGEAKRRFHREAQCAARLLHPNIAVIFDAGEEGGEEFIVMEYIEGIDLSRLVRRSGPLPVLVACDYMRQAALALQHAHELGLVHRDIKPANLILTRTEPKKKSSIIHRSLVTRTDKNPPQPIGAGVVKLLDLGLARSTRRELRGYSEQSLTNTDFVIGTPDFMSPEQGRDARTVDIRSDLYSLGCTFYFVLTGQAPFPAGPAVQKILDHMEKDPTPIEDLCSDITPVVASIVRRLMAKSPDDRFQTPSELVEALDAILANDGEPPEPIPLPAVIAPPRERAPASPRPQAMSRPPAAPKPQTALRHGLEPVSESAVDLQGGLRPVDEFDRELLLTQVVSRCDLVQPVRKLGTIAAHNGCVLSLAFSSNGQRLASSGVDSRVRVWDLKTDPPVQIARLRGQNFSDLQALVFGPDRRTIYAGATTSDGAVIGWNGLGGEGEGLIGTRADQACIEMLSIGTDGTLLAAACSRSVWIWSINRTGFRSWRTLTEFTCPVKAVAFSPVGRQIATGDEAGGVRVWDLGRVWNTEVIRINAHTAAVATLMYSPNGKWLATSGMDNRIHIWDLAAKSTIGSSFEVPSAVAQLRFLQGGSQLMVVTRDGQIVVWDIQTGSRRWTSNLGVGFLVAIAVADDGHHIASAASDGSISLFELDMPQDVDEMPRAATAVARKPAVAPR